MKFICALLPAALAACGGKDDDPPASDPALNWPGTYNGNLRERLTCTLNGEPGSYISMAQTSVLVTAGPGRAVITINSDQSCPVLADVTTTSATWRRKTCPPSTRDEGTVSTTTYESGMSTLSAPYPLSATRTITSNYRVTHVFSTGGVGSCVGDGTETVTR